MKISKIFTWKEIGSGCLSIVKMIVGTIVLAIISLLICIMGAIVLTLLYPVFILLLIPGTWIAFIVLYYLSQYQKLKEKEKAEKEIRDDRDD